MSPLKQQILPLHKRISIVADCPLASILSPFSPGCLRMLLGIMMQLVPFPILPVSIELHLVSDGEIAALNEEYLQCPGPTNILTFPGDASLPAYLFLSLPCLFRECYLYGQAPQTHLIRLLAHGCAHLAGLDHGAQMTQIEEQCFEAAQNILAP